MNDDKIRISPDALIAMIVTEAQDRELARMPSLEEMNEDFQPSEKFQRKMEALVRDTKRKAERKKRLLNVKRFFITLTAAISIFSCTMLPVKAVREAVITTLIEWHDKFVSIIYVNVYYACSTYKNRSRTACTMHSIKHNRLEAAVLFAVQQQIHLAVSYSEMIARINTAPVKKSQSIRLEELIAAKERELAKISRYKQSLYQDWKDGEITQQDYRDMKADYERQTIALTDVLARLNAERAELANGVKSEHPALVAFTKHQNIDQLSRELLVELIDHIKVYENGNISVRFKFADEFRRIAEYIEINTTKPAVAG